MAKKKEIKKLTIVSIKDDVLTVESFEILKKSHKTCIHFLSVYDALYKILRPKTKGKGKPTDKEQDMLRAMLVFSTAAVDTVLKNLIKNNLKKSIQNKDLAKEEFKKFVKRKVGGIKNSGKFFIDVDFIADSLSEDNPKEFILNNYIKNSISGSLQSISEIEKISKRLGFKVNRKKIKLKDYEEIFKARNEIVHQMDIKKGAKTKIPRKRDDLVDMVNKIFYLIEYFITEVRNIKK